MCRKWVENGNGGKNNEDRIKENRSRARRRKDRKEDAKVKKKRAE
jgi:hypothetical protein